MIENFKVIFEKVNQIIVSLVEFDYEEALEEMKKESHEKLYFNQNDEI
ncbi:MAG TPA: hypothetical protein VNM45_14025 [Bacillus sp. (in: firmicutes)]|nr:hypothetical protein [Bacillus sp. (in: firmicutes)]